VDNAVKYAPPGSEIQLGGRVERGEVVLEVRDQGPGIPPEDLPHVIERFYRAEQARASSGTGLGLAIAHWIVEEHGGEIAVTSTPGHGATVTVRLPALAATSAIPSLGASEQRAGRL
jgi:signal transduction histidine kinase